jgi:hypothetical protein
MKLAIVGIFYDGYEDLWYDFLNLIYNNWRDCPYELYIINNETELSNEYSDYSKVKVIHAGKDAEFSQKVRLACDSIDADYLLLLLEDFFVCKSLNGDVLKKILLFIEKENIDYYTMPMPEFQTIKEHKKYKQEKNIFKISLQKEYIFSCQPSIWKREFLRFCIGEGNYNAWIFEGIFAKSKSIRNEKFLEKSVVDYTNPLSLHHGALQGKLLKSIRKLFKKMNYVPITKRKYLSSHEEFVHIAKESIIKILNFLHLNHLKKSKVLDRYKEDIDFRAQKMFNEKKIIEYCKKRDKQYEI